MKRNMKLEQEQVLKALQNGVSEAVNSAKSELHLITEQINNGLEDNKVTKVQYQVDFKCSITVDLETMKITAKGGYGAKTANLCKWGNEIEMEIENPNQPGLGLNSGKKSTTPPAPTEKSGEIGD